MEPVVMTAQSFVFLVTVVSKRRVRPNKADDCRRKHSYCGPDENRHPFSLDETPKSVSQAPERRFIDPFQMKGHLAQLNTGGLACDNSFPVTQ